MLEGSDQAIAVKCCYITHWKNKRVRAVQQVRNAPETSGQRAEISKTHVLAWLERIKNRLDITVPDEKLCDEGTILAVAGTLLPRGALVGCQKTHYPAWKEMALIGDGLWTVYLRIMYIKKGYSNGETPILVHRSGFVTRQSLSRVAHELDLVSLLPIPISHTIVSGELAEAFLGWAYMFAGEQASALLAKKYLEILQRDRP